MNPLSAVLLPVLAVAAMPAAAVPTAAKPADAKPAAAKPAAVMLADAMSADVMQGKTSTAKPPASASPATEATLALEATIALPGVDGRIDHLAIDLGRRRLFVAALEHGSLEVVDLEIKKRLRSITNLSEPQGVLFLEKQGQVVVSNGGSGTLDVFDAGSLEKVVSVKVGEDADNLRYDPLTELVYVGYGEGALAIVDTKEWKVAGEVPLGGHPESFQFDATTKRAFVNVPGKREIAVVDLALRRVVERWPVKESEKNFPMAIQGADRRVFVACRQPPKLLVLDPANGRTFDTLDLSSDADDVFLDEASGRVYVSCGAGSIDVFQRGEKGAYASAGRVATAPGARTCLYSPGEEKLYLAVPHRGEQRAEIRVYVTGR
jgi:DNA-binding beta-propeller fold protein YncE